MAGLAVNGSLALLGVPSVVAATVAVVVREAEVLAELEEGEEGDFGIRTAEPVHLLELVLCRADVGGGVGSQPVEVVGLRGVHVGTVGDGEQQRRADDARVVAERVGEVGARAGEAGAGADLKPFRHVAADVGADAVASVARVLDDARLTGVVAREEEPSVAVASADAEVVVVRGCRLEDFVLPVGSCQQGGVAVFVVVPSGVDVVLRAARVFACVVDGVAVAVVLVAPRAGVGDVVARAAHVEPVV